MNKIMIFLLISSTIPLTASFVPNGYCKKSVADLLGGPIKSFFPESQLSNEELYKKMPCEAKNRDCICPRICQLVYNDPVEILEYRGSEVHVKVPQWTYIAQENTYQTYWTEASAIAPLTPNTAHLHPNNIPYQTKNQSIIVLHKPFFCYKTNTHYAIGSRFVLAPKKNTSRHGFKVLIEKSGASKTITLPRTVAHYEEQADPDTIRHLFINFLHDWAHQKHGAFPYVIGGCTANTTITPDHYQTDACCNNKGTAFVRPHLHSPYGGFDCARLITRAAQVSGLPFYATNSTTIVKTLPSLKPYEYPQNGDLIYMNKHICAISNVDKGLLIEARCYSHGYGIVHEIPFHEQFKDIHTTDDLVAAYRAKKPIIRLDSNGNPLETIRITLLKLC